MLNYFKLGLVFSMVLWLAACMNHRPAWGYRSSITPKNWSKYYPECGNEIQSPINIPRQIWRDDELAHLQFSFPTDALSVTNNSHSFEFDFADQNDVLTIGAHRYHLIKMLMHMPSENHIVDQRYPMEWQFVYQDDQDQIIVVAVMVIRGRENPAMSKMIPRLPRVGHRYLLTYAKINPSDLLPRQLTYYNFMGSLTTPPCTGGVQWYLLKQPITASEMQLNLFREHYARNIRPLQPLNGRMVKTNA